MEERFTPMTAPDNLAVRVVHQNPLVRAGIVALIDQQSDLDVQAGRGAADEAVDVIVADYASALGLLAGAPARPGPDRRLPRIVVVTGRDRGHDLMRAINSGAHGYLLRDASPLELIDSIRQVARGGNRYLCRRAAAVFEGSARDATLTAREEDVLRLLVQGDCNKAIARSLDISTHTVKAHVSRICEKLHASSRAHAAVRAAQRGLVRH